MVTVPKDCHVRGCSGRVTLLEASGEKWLQCEAKKIHQAWLTRAAGGSMQYEWTTRGKSGLKGAVVKDSETSSPRQIQHKSFSLELVGGKLLSVQQRFAF